MKLISWNVNGLRACMTKGLYGFFSTRRTPIFSACRRRSFRQGQIEMELPGYEQFWNYAEKKGYSGTAILQSRNLCRSHTALELRNTITRAE